MDLKGQSLRRGGGDFGEDHKTFRGLEGGSSVTNRV